MVLVIAQRHKFRMAQVIRACPFQKIYAYDATDSWACPIVALGGLF
jgi:hypothetical protein